MKRSLLVMVIGLLMVSIMAGTVFAAENGTENTGSEAVSTESQQQTTANDTSKAATDNANKASSDGAKQTTTDNSNKTTADDTKKTTTGSDVRQNDSSQETIKFDPNDPTPFIKPMTGGRMYEWLMGLGLRSLDYLTKLAYLIFSIIIVLGAVVMVLPSLNSHPVMKWTGISMVVGGFMGFVIVMLYPMILGILRGAVSTL